MILETGFSWNGVLLYALVGVPLTLAQYALASRFGWIVPDLALILVIHAAFFRGAHEAGWIALLLGALCDLASGGFFGYFIVLRVAVLIGVRIGANWVLSEAPLFQFPAAFAAAFFEAMLGWILLSLFTDAAPAAGEYFYRAPLRALLTAAVAPLLAWMLNVLYEKPVFNLAKRGLRS